MRCRDLIVVLGVVVMLFSCSQPSKEITELHHFSIDGMEGIITHDDVEFDRGISSDGGGSLKITVTEPTIVRLFEIPDINVENGRLIYQARIRTEDVDGRVYLEMWCHFPGRGEFFSRSLHNLLSGTTDWTTQETPFLLKKGENPDLVKLNLVLDGEGTAWIDDIRLFKGPLE